MEYNGGSNNTLAGELFPLPCVRTSHHYLVSLTVSQLKAVQTMQYHRLIVLVTLGLVLCQACAHAEGVLTPKMQDLAAHAEALTATQFTRRDWMNDTKSKDFSLTIDALGTLMTPDIARRCSHDEGYDPYAKYALIAWDRRQNPQIYQELSKEYLYLSIPNGGGREAPQSAPLSPKHATEKYRLAWEYLMLAPSAMAYASMYADRVTEALATIHDAASVETYRIIFTFSTSLDVDPISVQDQQQRWLYSLGRFHNLAALRAILDFEEMVRTQGARRVVPWSYTEFAEEVLAPMYDPAEDERWRVVIAALPVNAVTPSQYEIVKDVLKKIATNPAIQPGLDPVLVAWWRTKQAKEMKEVKAEETESDVAKSKSIPSSAAQFAP